MNSIFELWSENLPERAIACSFNLQYLLVGGRDLRRGERPIFMWYDWMVGGWGSRNGKDGSNATAPIFGVGPAVQRFEDGTSVSGAHDRPRDPHRLGRTKWRGGCGVEKGATLTEAEGTVMSYLRPRSLDRLGAER